MIIDSFIYYNEEPAVEIRINELKDVVDKFIVISGVKTWRGNENVYHFPKHLRDIADIEVYRMAWPEHLTLWEAERWLRNQMYQKLKRFPRNTVAIFSDADEIARPSVIENFHGRWARLEIDQYYYNFNTYIRHHDCMFVCQIGALRPNMFDMRFYNPIRPVIEAGGWEFSFFGDVQFIKNKIRNYSHDEIDLPEYTDEEKIQYRIDNGIDIIDRPIEGAPKGPLPEYVLNNKEKFARFWKNDDS